ncbi:hypothetical protein A4A49_52519 [Nicotiana attenuata]|uniref:Uncharacterized protein n=1 Tax=Nicotiana attenuata TaxID=49451 RepID=A0A1J6IF41_NICAT|nr:hypothetical protein A4A49_52519 [Nicotiana attenuata]
MLEVIDDVRIIAAMATNPAMAARAARENGGNHGYDNNEGRNHNNNVGTRTLMRAYILARLAEQSLKLRREQSQLISRNTRSLFPNPKSSWPPRNYSQNSSNTSSRETEGSRLFANSSRPTMRTSRRLTPAEMDEKRAQGLCYWCDEKYVPGHKCKKNKQLFILEVDEDMEEWKLEESLAELTEGHDESLQQDK